jgi:hypothetical protein
MRLTVTSLNMAALLSASRISSPMTIQARQDSDLPERLKGLGYDLAHTGTSERLMPETKMVTQHGTKAKVARQHMAVTPVETFTFDLPFAAGRRELKPE